MACNIMPTIAAASGKASNFYSSDKPLLILTDLIDHKQRQIRILFQYGDVLVNEELYFFKQIQPTIQSLL